jgi:hypothetical protein
MPTGKNTTEKYVVSYRGRQVLCTQKNYEKACELLFAKSGLPKGDHPQITSYRGASL